MAILKLNEYYEFVRWLALPEPVRQPQTQKELAESLGIREETLCAWKNDPNFYEDVRREIERWAKDRTTNVVAGLYKKAVRDGDAAACKLWFQYIEKYEEKSKVEHGGDIIQTINIQIKEEKKIQILAAFENFGIIPKQNESNTNTNINEGISPRLDNGPSGTSSSGSEPTRV